MGTLSGKSLREVILRTGGPLASIAALQAGGFGTYLALATVMHTVFTSVLGITLPFAAYTGATSALSLLTGPLGIMFSLGLGALGYFWGRQKIERSQYGMIVFTCVVAAGHRLTPTTAALPSAKRSLLLGGLSTEPHSAPPDARQDDLALQDGRRTLEVLAGAARVAQKSLDGSTSSVSKLVSRLSKAEVRLAAAVGKNYEDQALRASLERQMEVERREIARLAGELDRARSNAEMNKKDLADREFQLGRAKQKHNSHLERRSKELKALWSIHFRNMDFQPQPLRWAADQDFAAWLEIERALKEMSDSSDPAALSRSKMHVTGEHHSSFTIPNGVPCRIFYIVSAGRIEVRRMCKKKDV